MSYQGEFKLDIKLITDSMNVNRNNDSLVQNNNVFNPSLITRTSCIFFFFSLLLNSIKQTFDIWKTGE